MRCGWYRTMDGSDEGRKIDCIGLNGRCVMVGVDFKLEIGSQSVSQVKSPHEGCVFKADGLCSHSVTVNSSVSLSHSRVTYSREEPTLWALAFL